MPIETADDLAEFFDPDEFGTAVSYLPAGGPAVIPAAALWDHSDVDVAFARGHVITERNRFTFLVTSIPKPAVGDFITVVASATVYVVRSEPMLNGDGTMWTCGCSLYQD